MSEYWHGLGSDERYKPKWYERRAYAQALLDANRIIEKETWDRDRSPKVKVAMQAIFARSQEFDPDEKK